MSVPPRPRNPDPPFLAIALIATGAAFLIGFALTAGVILALDLGGIL